MIWQCVGEMVICAHEPQHTDTLQRTEARMGVKLSVPEMPRKSLKSLGAWRPCGHSKSAISDPSPKPPGTG
jgi:hypothetical protein